MSYIADLHIHSHFAAACSKELTLTNLAAWAKIKGIDLLGTGDALHPGWLQEIKDSLNPTDEGIYEFEGTKFLYTSEVSCIYHDKGRFRRIHILLFLPSFETAQQTMQALEAKGANLTFDGRPVFTFSARALCDLVWDVDPAILVVPAHAWTPWFSVYGSIGGYDSLQDCFEDYTERILAVETGLSSEPRMNWRLKELDNKAIVSFSDAHSLPRLGREVTVFKETLNFPALVKALQNQQIEGTIEFFPEEGKYHYSGHRKCGVVYGPEELKEKGSLCPVCGRKLTIGVVERIEALATRTEVDLKIKDNNGFIGSDTFPNRAGFRQLIQLEEIIAESLHKGVRTLTVQNEYHRLINELGNEIKILTELPLKDIRVVAGDKITEGIDRARRGQVITKPGFDNTYGQVSIFG